MLPSFHEVQPDTYIRRYTVGNVQVVFRFDVVVRGRMVVFKYYSPFDHKVMVFDYLASAINHHKAVCLKNNISFW